jgi:hypothetical protein
MWVQIYFSSFHYDEKAKKFCRYFSFGKGDCQQSIECYGCFVFRQKRRMKWVEGAD